MNLQLIDIVNSVATFQLLVFIVFLLRRRSSRGTGFWEQPNRLLSYFLVVQVILVLNYECLHLQKDLISLIPHAFYVGVPFLFLPAPIFYFYVRSLAFSDFRFRTADLVHTIPFLVVVIVLAHQFFLLPSDAKILLLTEKRAFSDSFWIGFNLIFLAQFSTYFVLDLRILRYYRGEIKQQYSSIARINLSWLTVILHGYIIAWLSSVASVIARSAFLYAYDVIAQVNFVAFFCFFNYIFYKGWSQPEIFSGILEKPRYEASRLTLDEGREYLARLESHMQSRKPYLNPTLTLKDLASQVDLSPRYLSQIINEHTHQNFYDFVNRYRIEEAKRLLREQSDTKNITEILYAVGFNSKSSFNTAFKQVTGVSPSHFRRHTPSAAPVA